MFGLLLPDAPKGIELSNELGFLLVSRNLVCNPYSQSGQELEWNEQSMRGWTS
jgi:hypothetical protein